MERTTVETAVTMMEDDLAGIRRNLGDINDETSMSFSQPVSQEGSPISSTQVPVEDSYLPDRGGGHHKEESKSECDGSKGAVGSSSELFS